MELTDEEIGAIWIDRIRNLSWRIGGICDNIELLTSPVPYQRSVFDKRKSDLNKRLRSLSAELLKYSDEIMDSIEEIEIRREDYFE